MRLVILAAFLAAAAGLPAEGKIALLGDFPEDKSVETLAAQMGIDAHNAVSSAARLRLVVSNGGAGVDSSLKAAQALTADPDVLAVVTHGEAASAPAVLQALRGGGLAVVAASAWAVTRSAGSGVVWLSPGLPALAESAGAYARKEAKASQVAVVDNGADTAAAATRVFTQRFRALGGKVPLDTTWNGSDEDLPATLKVLAAHWPQMVFFAGEPAAAGRLVKAMRGEKALKAADLILLPNAFDPPFFAEGRLDARRTRALFPCTDFVSSALFMRNLGFAFPKSAPEYRAYLAYAYRRPGRWTSMIFDAVALCTRAVREAAPGEAVATRETVAKALDGIDGYRGIRGAVKFNALREPSDARVMVYYALNKVNKKEMQWREKAWGPPF
jgi:ABC-type branched-subunit amino acid transport system substrate-binding protein